MKRIALLLFFVLITSAHLTCMEKDPIPIKQDDAELLKLEKIDTSTELIKTFAGMVERKPKERTTLVNALHARARTFECFLSENLAIKKYEDLDEEDLDIVDFDHIINDQLKLEEISFSKLSPLSKFFLKQLDELLVKENSELTMKSIQVYINGRKKLSKKVKKYAIEDCYDLIEWCHRIIKDLCLHNYDSKRESLAIQTLKTKFTAKKTYQQLYKFHQHVLDKFKKIANIIVKPIQSALTNEKISFSKKETKKILNSQETDILASKLNMDKEYIKKTGFSENHFFQLIRFTLKYNYHLEKCKKLDQIFEEIIPFDYVELYKNADHLRKTYDHTYKLLLTNEKTYCNEPLFPLSHLIEKKNIGTIDACIKCLRSIKCYSNFKSTRTNSQRLLNRQINIYKEYKTKSPQYLSQLSYWTTWLKTSQSETKNLGHSSKDIPVIHPSFAPTLQFYEDLLLALKQRSKASQTKRRNNNKRKNTNNAHNNLQTNQKNTRNQNISNSQKNTGRQNNNKNGNRKKRRRRKKGNQPQTNTTSHSTSNQNPQQNTQNNNVQNVIPPKESQDPELTKTIQNLTQDLKNLTLEEEKTPTPKTQQSQAKPQKKKRTFIDVTNELALLFFSSDRIIPIDDNFDDNCVLIKQTLDSHRNEKMTVVLYKNNVQQDFPQHLDPTTTRKRLVTDKFHTISAHIKDYLHYGYVLRPENTEPVNDIHNYFCHQINLNSGTFAIILEARIIHNRHYDPANALEDRYKNKAGQHSGAYVFIFNGHTHQCFHAFFHETRISRNTNRSSQLYS